jgi:sulfide:quinone oxidoreductase
MSHIIVIGAGLGGLPAAIELRSRLGKQHRITLIASSPHLEFTRVNPWIAVGWRKCATARSAPQRPLELLGVQWLAEAVTGIDAPAACLHLRSGSTLAYDYLVIADEPVGAPQAIPGMELLGSARGVCTHQQAQHAWSEYQKFLSDPGPVIIAAVGSPRCAGHAYELSLILDADLRARGLRDLVPLTLSRVPRVAHGSWHTSCGGARSSVCGIRRW